MVNAFSLDYSLHEENNVRRYQFADVNNPLRDFDEVHYCSLAEAFCDWDYGNARGMMILYVSTTINTKGAIYPTDAYNVNEMKLLKKYVT